jgi:hypothetical protein
MNNAKFQAHLTALRRYGPTWADLRVFGNSRPVQIATIFPIVGYFILLSTRLTNLIDGGIAGPPASGDLIDAAWSFKLYFVYFGLISLGTGSAIYQLDARATKNIPIMLNLYSYILRRSPRMN